MPSLWQRDGAKNGKERAERGQEVLGVYDLSAMPRNKSIVVSNNRLKLTAALPRYLRPRSAPRGQSPDFFPEISWISTLITAIFRSVSSE